MKSNRFVLSKLHRACCVAISLASSLTFAQEWLDEVDECETLDICIAKIYDTAEVSEREYGSLTGAEWRLVARLREFGEDAVSPLIAVLKEPNDNIAGIAAAALSGLPEIDDKYLPEIIAGLDRNLGWLPGALGRIKTTEAGKEAVERLLNSDSAPQNQEAFAVRVSGEWAIPHMVEAAKCAQGCGGEDHYYLAYVLAEMGSERAIAAEPLFETVVDRTSSDQAVTGSLSMIGKLGEYGLILEERLLRLRAERPDLTHAIDMALIGIGSLHSGDIFTEMLMKEPSILTLRDIAERGAEAQTAGPFIVSLLSHRDWETRVGAARTLGYIGYRAAAKDLMPLLSSEEDVWLNWVAAQSLGRLKAREAIDALRTVANDHWYPAVRAEAVLAIQHIEKDSEYISGYHPDNFPFEYFSFSNMGEHIDRCEEVALGPFAARVRAETDAEADSHQTERLTYDVQITTILPKDSLSDWIGHYEIVREIPKNFVEIRHTVARTPGVAIKVGRGWIAGSDLGEFGGELVYFESENRANVLVDGPIENIHQWDDQYIAVAGQAHLFSNEGKIYRITGKGSSWTTELWRRLPGAPLSSMLVETGELLVNVYGGSILIARDGTMGMAPCKNR